MPNLKDSAGCDNGTKDPPSPAIEKAQVQSEPHRYGGHLCRGSVRVFYRAFASRIITIYSPHKDTISKLVLHNSPYFVAGAGLRMNGCFSASSGVHLRSGFRFKHRSSKSTNKFSSFSSVSVPEAADTSLDFSSRVGLVKFSSRTTSCPQS